MCALVKNTAYSLLLHVESGDLVDKLLVLWTC